MFYCIINTYMFYCTINVGSGLDCANKEGLDWEDGSGIHYSLKI